MYTVALKLSETFKNPYRIKQQYCISLHWSKWADPFALVFEQCTKLKVENSQPFPFTLNCKVWILNLRVENFQPRFVHLFSTHELPMDCSKLDPVLSWIISLNHMYCPDLSLKDLALLLRDFHSSTWGLHLKVFCSKKWFYNLKFSYLRIKHLHFFQLKDMRSRSHSLPLKGLRFSSPSFQLKELSCSSHFVLLKDLKLRSQIFLLKDLILKSPFFLKDLKSSYISCQPKDWRSKSHILPRKGLRCSSQVFLLKKLRLSSHFFLLEDLILKCHFLYLMVWDLGLLDLRSRLHTTEWLEKWDLNFLT